MITQIGCPGNNISGLVTSSLIRLNKTAIMNPSTSLFLLISFESDLNIIEYFPRYLHDESSLYTN